MTVVFLVRHGAHDLLGHTMAGRMPGVALNQRGRAQAQAIAARLCEERLVAVHTSPSQRARETAMPLAEAVGLPAVVDEAFDEIDIGRWTGMGFAALDGDSDWQRWNAVRGQARCPGGESFAEVQTRVARGLEAIGDLHPEAAVAIVSHADAIKAMLMFFLGLPLDFHGRFDIDPGSISTAVYGSWGAKVLRMNEGVAA
ncbi:MAG: Phosphoglycerate mutase [Rhodospirillales bacterium]|nr:Phosphoglycerate mutase [Rhodospirillales bacterium]